MKKAKKTVLQISGGLLVGFINGFFGGGGGMLCVPLLERVLGEPTKKAHATAILVILPICVASAVTYIINGYFAPLRTLTTGVGVIAGGTLGALLLKKLPPFAVGVVFALLMICVGVRMAFFG